MRDIQNQTRFSTSETLVCCGGTSVWDTAQIPGSDRIVSDVWSSTPLGVHGLQLHLRNISCL